MPFLYIYVSEILLQIVFPFEKSSVSLHLHVLHLLDYQHILALVLIHVDVVALARCCFVVAILCLHVIYIRALSDRKIVLKTLDLFDIRQTLFCDRFIVLKIDENCIWLQQRVNGEHLNYSISDAWDYSSTLIVDVLVVARIQILIRMFICRLKQKYMINKV